MVGRAVAGTETLQDLCTSVRRQRGSERERAREREKCKCHHHHSSSSSSSSSRNAHHKYYDYYSNMQYYRQYNGTVLTVGQGEEYRYMYPRIV